MTEQNGRQITAAAAWMVGAAVYVFAKIESDGYDGLPDAILLPCCGSIVSGFVVAATLALGLILRPTPLSRWWRSSRVWAATTAALSGVMLVFGTSLGLTNEYVHPDSGERFVGLHTSAALAGYFLLLFAAAHWPTGRGD